MSMSAPLPRMTSAEYLELERAADFKSEFVNGEIVAMAGASIRHNDIVAGVMLALSRQLTGRPCQVNFLDVKVKSEATDSYFYPDLIVICGGIVHGDHHRDTLVNPTVLVEVLSPSTEAYDRGAKAAHYRLIESVQEYVLIAQDQPMIEVYSRQGNHWLLSEARALDEAVELASISCRLPLSEVYERVDFAPPASPDSGELA